MAAVSQLFARLSQEIEEQKPKNCIHFMVDFLCKHYPEHLHGFASIWQMDPDLERERHEVVNFFKAHKISTAVAAHFTNAGFDTLDTLTTLSPDSLVDVEAFNNVKWLPGHKVRLQQIFGEISARVRAYRQQYGESAVSQQQQHHHRRHHHHASSRSDSPPSYHRPQAASYAPHSIANHPAATTHHIGSHVATHAVSASLPQYHQHHPVVAAPMMAQSHMAAGGGIYAQPQMLPMHSPSQSPFLPSHGQGLGMPASPNLSNNIFLANASPFA